MSTPDSDFSISSIRTNCRSAMPPELMRVSLYWSAGMASESGSSRVFSPRFASSRSRALEIRSGNCPESSSIRRFEEGAQGAGARC